MQPGPKLAEGVPYVRGMDIVPEAVEYVRSLGLRCDCAGSVQELDIPENSQAIISILDCNYYWSNQRNELRALYSRLCPDGILVMRWKGRQRLWTAHLAKIAV